MTAYSLDPAWVRLDYHSIYGSHVMLIPTLDWVATPVTGTMGSYISWSTTPRDGEAMIDDMVTVLADLHVATTSFDLATVYQQASPTSPAFIRAFKALAVAGTAGAIGAAKAIQSQLNMRTTLGGPFKLTLLDASALNIQMDKIKPLGFTAEISALSQEAASPSNAWAGRDNTRPNAGLSWTMTESNALRRRYRKG